MTERYTRIRSRADIQTDRQTVIMSATKKQAVGAALDSPNKMEIMKRDLLGLTGIIAQDELGQRKFKKCKKCNRPTLGHEKPGYGEKRCQEKDVVSDKECERIFKDLYAARGGQFRKRMEETQVDRLYHCQHCDVDLFLEGKT